MDNKMKIFQLSVLWSVLLFCSSSLRAEPKEPPLKCGIDRTSWCIVKNADDIKVSVTKKDKWREWRIFDNYWKREVGLVLEKKRCPALKAEGLWVSSVNGNVLWEGEQWQEVVVDLRKDKLCTLRLLVPTRNREFRRKAASSLSGHIAACLPNQKCTSNVLSTHVYKLLDNGQPP
jgi:hypothetical protein